MGIEHVDILRTELPQLFPTRNIPPEQYDDLLIIPITEPDLISSDIEMPEETVADESLNATENLTEIDIFENRGPDLIEQSSRILEISPIIYDAFRGKHGGAPVPYIHQPFTPPPECPAFYLPFHYYQQDLWGIYLIYDGVIWLAGEIIRLGGGKVTKRQAFEAARLFLYHHEAFHHKTECFATRLELTHRQPFFTTGFEHYYQRTLGSINCTEEGLANSSGLIDSYNKLRNRNIDKALINFVEQNPPGYDQGEKYRPEIKRVKCDFAEENHLYCLPNMPKRNPEIWRTAPHLFDGISNIKSRVNYIISRNSPLINRMKFRPCLPPNKLIKKLRELVGLEFVREGGRHQVWRTSAGKIVEIPRHPRDLGRGLLRDILNQVGLKMGLNEFLSL